MSTISEKIREVALRKAIKVIAVSYNSLRNRTPVITGFTKSQWRIIIDGVQYDSLPTKDQLKKAKKVEIRNLQKYMSTLDEKYAIIALTKVEVDDLIRSLQ